MENVKIPGKIREIIGARSYSVDEVGMSGSQVICFKDMVLKIEKSGPVAANEHRMMRWLSGKLPVPEVLEFAVENGFHYLLMSRIRGKMACAPEYLEKPAVVAELLAEGLRMLWNVDISGCPTDHTLPRRLKEAERRVAGGLCSVENAQPGVYGSNGFASPEALLKWLLDNQPDEQPVFSHGDFCLPNVLGQDGIVTGFIDLGSSGYAGREHDIMTCHQSLRRNWDGTFGGPVYRNADADILFSALGYVPDREKLRYYMLLDELF